MLILIHGVDKKSVNPDQKASSEKLADLDLHCFQKRVQSLEKVMHTVYILQ